MPVVFQRSLVSLMILASLRVLSAEPVPAHSSGEIEAVVPVKDEASWVDARWNLTNVGPFLCYGLPIPGGHIHKGISIRLGNDDASVCFDSKRLGIRAAWTGGFLKFDGARFGLGKWPKPVGTMLVTLPDSPCWGEAKTHYNGMHVHDKLVVLDYRVGEMNVLESPGVEKNGESVVVTRTFHFAPSEHDELCALGEVVGAAGTVDGARIGMLTKGESVVAFGLLGASGVALKADTSRMALSVPKHAAAMDVRVLMWAGKVADAPAFVEFTKKNPLPDDISYLAQPAGPRWGEPLKTQGKISAEKNAYVMDTITAPYDNPFKAMLFMSGLDFFENGDAAVCTLHGDVWRVSGIDDTLNHVTWQRYATGLFQPMGLKIIGNKVHVLGRDQITILHDLNNDGEADFYENFNNDAETSKGGHDFSACLETDRAGNFYHIDPYGIHRISKDGKNYETLAAGWRNPIAMSVGPNDELTVSPQEGTWTPSSEICAVVKDGWYGFGGPKKTDARPLGYDQPLCFIPHKVENSTGGHLWIASDKWGPFNGKMLNLSFGQAIIQLVLREKVDGVEQGGVFTFPLRFLAGTIRGRFNAKDGQLYVVGTKGWQTVAPADGAFQRVRYTGAPVVMPVALNVHANGIRVTFTEPLSREDAADADNYSVEQWNYLYSAKYGSDDYSVADPAKKGRDEVKIKSAQLSADGKSVFLEIPDLKPVMQMQIKYKLHSAAGEKVRGDVYHTINKVGAPFK